MKNIAVIIAIFLLWAGPIFSQTYKLTVCVTGISETGGNMIISVYNNASFFPKPDHEYKTHMVAVRNKTVCTTFRLPGGQYAIALFYDINRNGKCDKTLGIPIEPFGFSNNIRPTYKAPSFSQCKINLDKDKTISIKLIYL